MGWKQSIDWRTYTKQLCTVCNTNWSWASVCASCFQEIADKVHKENNDPDK